jgi:tRNA threonylcarbamoyladenosine biosynthesis protein TsaE
MQLSFTLPEIEIVAQKLLDQASTTVIRIDGEMGAGKTTLIATIVKLLGVNEGASSPTFS